MFLATAGCAPDPETGVAIRRAGAAARLDDQEEDGAPSPGSTNVLIVLADDLGIDIVDAYGVPTEHAAMPTVASLAAEGVLFENAYATPLCSSTRSALMTGRLGRRTGAGAALSEGDPAWGLPLSEVTLPEMLLLADQAWSTAAVGKWHLANRVWPGWERHPLDQGFDYYAGSPSNLGAGGSGFFRWSKNTLGTVAETRTYATTDSADEAIGQLAVMQEPWLLYLAFNGIHEPAHVPPAALMQGAPQPSSSDPAWVKARAAGTALDTELARVLAAIPPDVRVRTTILFAGDNGTASGAARPPYDADRVKGSVYDGGVHVPLIVAGPYVAAPGSRSDALVHVVDIFPTVAEIAGVDLALLEGPLGGPPALDGRSLLPLLEDPGRAADRSTLYFERFSPFGAPPYRDIDISGIRDERYALTVERQGGMSLFDLEASWPLTGPNLLDDGIDLDELEAYNRLVAELNDYRALPYEHF